MESLGPLQNIKHAHQFATNASVANAAASISADDFNRSRAATIGSLQSVSDGSNPIWEVTHSNRGHRITAITDAYNTWSLAHDKLGRVVQAIDRTYTYDPMGRLLWTEDAGGIIESYLYDGDGRLARVNTHSGTSL